jgi:hypothetical protein
MNDDAVRIAGGRRERQGRGVGVRQAAGEAVLDDEGARCPGDAEHGSAALRGQHRAGGVVEQLPADERPGPGGLERLGRQVDAYAAGVDRYRDGP